MSKLHRSHLAVLRVLAGSDSPLTVKAIVDEFTQMGPGNFRTESSVRNSLQMMDTGHDPSLVRRAGLAAGSLSITWTPTADGRRALGAEESR